MNPDDGEHDTYIDVEPTTGITMKGRVRIQVNFRTSQTDLWYPNITEAMMPILWFEDRSEITEELAEEFKDLVYGALDLQQNLNFLTLGAAAIFGVPGAIFTTTQAIKRRKMKIR
jgi:lysosome membrane protein 2